MGRVLLGDAADTSRIFRYFPRLKSDIHGSAVQKVTPKKQKDCHGFLDTWVGECHGIHAMEGRSVGLPWDWEGNSTVVWFLLQRRASDSSYYIDHKFI
jgi:hypothetical protein